MSDPKAAVLETIDGMRDELVKLAVDLGNIEAPTGREGPAGEFALQWMKENGFGGEKVGVFDDRFNAIGRLRGSGGGLSLSFNSHLDTIMAREDVTRFRDASDRLYHEAWHDDGKIYGYAVVNCKGPMACWMTAAKALKKANVPLKGDVVLAAVCGEIDCEPVDEFQGHDYLAEDIGTRYAVTHGALSDYALVAEATNFKPAWVEAGKVFLKVTVFAGPSRYTPYVPRRQKMLESPNSIVRMASLIESIEEWADQYQERYTRRYDGGTVVPRAVIGAIRGGVPYKIYRFPELCSIYLDIRLNPDTQPLVVQREIEDIVRKLGLDAEVKPFLFRRGYEAQGIEPLKDALEDAHRSILGSVTERPGSPECSMWRDTNPYNELGIPSLTYGCGAGAGGGNTFFLVDEMLQAAKIYALTAMDICNRSR